MTSNAEHEHEQAAAARKGRKRRVAWRTQVIVISAAIEGGACAMCDAVYPAVAAALHIAALVAAATLVCHPCLQVYRYQNTSNLRAHKRHDTASTGYVRQTIMSTNDVINHCRMQL